MHNYYHPRLLLSLREMDFFLVLIGRDGPDPCCDVSLRKISDVTTDHGVATTSMLLMTTDVLAIGQQLN